MDRKTVLHLGSGWIHLNATEYPSDEWAEIRVDLDPVVEPDIVADVANVPLPDGSADAFWCCHVLEHVPEVDLLPTLDGMASPARPRWYGPDHRS